MRSKDHLGPLGTLVSAALVGSCCVGPVLFLLFGASLGALSALSALEPLRLWFIAAALGFWGYGFHRLYLRGPATAGAACDGACERPSASARVLLWIALGALVVAMVYPALAVRLLG
jgi:mercuric ion transport protein